MSASVSLCERNGPFPGVATPNVSSISWKAVDDNSTSYQDYKAALAPGTNSYTKYNYIQFTGVFTTIANVKIKHSSGILPYGVQLMSSPSIAQSTDRKQYSAPTRSKDNVNLTNTNLGLMNTNINLLVGNAAPNADGASADGKSSSANNDGNAVYTNYFVTQLQVTTDATTGDLSNFSLQLTYDEL